MDGIGAELRRAREARGTSLREMATRTKISVGALEALERADFRKLPGGIFGRSFVRTYASEVGVDIEAAVERFGVELAEFEREADERRRARQPEVTTDDRRFLERQHRAYVILRSGLVVAGVAAVILLAWLGRYLWTAPGVPESLPTPGGDFRLPSGASATPDVPSPGNTGDAAGVTPSLPAGDVAPTGGVVEGAAVVPVVLELEFSDDCWLTLGIDAKAQQSQLFRAGDRARYEATTEILLDLGNAGAVRAVINGRPARSLGAAGTHVRTRITRDNLSQFYQ